MTGIVSLVDPLSYLLGLSTPFAAAAIFCVAVLLLIALPPKSSKVWTVKTGKVALYRGLQVAA